MLDASAEALLTTVPQRLKLQCAPSPCGGAQYGLAYGDEDAAAVTFLINTAAQGTASVNVQIGGALLTMPPLSVLVLDADSRLLYNSSALPSAEASPIVPIATSLEWNSWPDGGTPGVTWHAADFGLAAVAGDADGRRGDQDEASILLDLLGMEGGMAWVNGFLVAVYNLAAANCSVPRMDRCGASPVNATSPDGACNTASQRYYSVPPDALRTNSTNRLLLRETNTALCCANHEGCKPCAAAAPVIGTSSVRVCSRRRGEPARSFSSSPWPSPMATGEAKGEEITLAVEVEAIPALAAPARSLREPALRRLRVGAIQPAGWLQRELLLQARGITSQLPSFWSYLNQTKWMGEHGSEPEQFLPYFLAGLIPLSYQLPGEAYLAELRDRYVSHILSVQSGGATNGWLGPAVGTSATDSRNYWSKYAVPADISSQLSTSYPRPTLASSLAVTQVSGRRGL